MDAYEINSFKGGISTDPYRGVPGSFRFGYNLNLRKEDDSLTCNQALKKDSGSVVTDLIWTFVPATDGYLYGFGDAGCIYRKKTLAAAWEKVWTYNGTDAAGGYPHITGAAEYTNNDGAGNYVSYLYFATREKLHRIKLSDAGGSSWASTVQKDWKSIRRDSYWHSMDECMGRLLICTYNRLAMVDYEGNFNSNVLDIPDKHAIKTILGRDQFVIIGSNRGTIAEQAHLWTWDGLSPSWNEKRFVAERMINAMIDTSYIFIQAGNEGGLYYYDGNNILKIRNLPATGGQVYPGGMANFNGLPYFGVIGTVKNGVYSFGKLGINDVNCLNLEYVPSHGKLSGCFIGAVTVYNAKLVISWRDGSTYGVDIIDDSNKAVGRYEGLVFRGKAAATTKLWRQIHLLTKPLPSGTAVQVQYKVNNQTSWQTARTIDGSKDTFDMAGQTQAVFSFSPDALNGSNELEIALTLYPNSNTAPEVQALTVLFEDMGVL